MKIRLDCDKEQTLQNLQVEGEPITWQNSGHVLVLISQAVTALDS